MKHIWSFDHSSFTQKLDDNIFIRFKPFLQAIKTFWEGEGSQSFSLYKPSNISLAIANIFIVFFELKNIFQHFDSIFNGL